MAARFPAQSRAASDETATRGPATPYLRVSAVAKDQGFFVIACVTAIILALAPLIAAAHEKFYDFNDFYAAGNLVGTQAIEHLRMFHHWKHLHHMHDGAFAYPFGFAYFYGYCRLLPIWPAYALTAAVNIGLAYLLSHVLSVRFRVSQPLAILATYCWTPVASVIVLGQNTLLAGLLVVAAIGALETSAVTVCGICVGLLLYKPHFALVLLIWAILVRQIRIVVTAAAFLPVWYLLSAVASHDWSWPVRWLEYISQYRAADAAYNAQAVIGLPSLFERVGIPIFVSAIACLFVLVVALCMIRRCPLVETFVFCCAAIPSTSAHAMPYDAVLTLPAIFFLIRGPLSRRMTIFYAVYLLAFCSMFAKLIGVNLLAISTIAVAVLTHIEIQRRGAEAAIHPDA